jgi:hypothetical protein
MQISWKGTILLGGHDRIENISIPKFGIEIFIKNI